MSQDQVNLLIGVVADETTSFFHSIPEAVSEEVLYKAIGQLTNADAKQTVAAYRAKYPEYSAQRLLIEISSDLVFNSPTVSLMDKLAGNNANVFAYRFDYPSADPKFGACHCLELPFLFGNFETWKSAPMMIGSSDADNRQVSAHVQDLIITLAHKGDRFDQWPKYERDGRKALSIHVQSEVIELEEGAAFHSK